MMALTHGKLYAPACTLHNIVSKTQNLVCPPQRVELSWLAVFLAFWIALVLRWSGPCGPLHQALGTESGGGVVQSTKRDDVEDELNYREEEKKKPTPKL